MPPGNNDDAVRVLLDGYFIDRPYGFGRYVRELAYALDRVDSLDLVIPVPDSGEPVLRRLVRRARVIPLRNRFFPLWEQLVVPWLGWRHQCDLIHFPYGSMSLAWARRKSVVTVHDLMFLGRSETAQNALDRLAHVYRRCVFATQTRFAGRLVSVSETTRRHLSREAGVESTVIPNVCEAFATMYSTAHIDQLERPYFLHRGSLAPHKNTTRVVTAFRAVRSCFPEAELRVFGMTETEALACSLTGAGIRFLGKICDADLARLYRHAQAVLVPSIEEGFGLAIIEAFAFEVPVITSNRPPMADIAGAAALLVDPLQEDDIEKAMIRILGDRVLVGKMKQASQQRRQLFSSARIAEAMYDTYRRLKSQRTV